MLPFQKKHNVVFTVCSEKETEKAFEYYTKNVHQKSDTITLLNVFDSSPSTYEPLISDEVAYDPYLMKAETAERYNDAKKMLQKYMDKCSQMRLTCKEKIIPMKYPRISDEITKFANDNSDMIVMSGGKHSSLERFLIGSVTMSTISKSKVPVLVIPKQKE